MAEILSSRVNASFEHNGASIAGRAQQSRRECVTPSSKAALSAPRRELVELFQRINFGRLESLEVRSGQPVLNPRPIVVREIKFGAENGPRPELSAHDFSLKQKVKDLFTYFDSQKNFDIESLEIQHGLPFKMTVREVSA